MSTIDFYQISLALILCLILTILFYISSWYQTTMTDETTKLADSSNLQGLENVEPLPQGQPDEIVQFDDSSSRGFLSSGEIVRETSDLTRLQDEDFRQRVQHHQTNDNSDRDVPLNVENNDPVVHRDKHSGRLNLSIEFDRDDHSLNVQIVDAQGLIRPEQFSVPEMMLTFSLNGEKHQRIVVENAPIDWKTPMRFSTSFDNLIGQNLYIKASNQSDPSAPKDREVMPHKNNF